MRSRGRPERIYNCSGKRNLAVRVFANREEAGRALIPLLSHYNGRDDTIVLALPRGGVPVGVELAAGLRLPLEVFLVRKLGVPDHEELAMGAVASGGVLIENQDVIRSLRIPDAIVESVAALERRELARREQEYRGRRTPPVFQDRTVILTDDGLATGSTMRAAVAALRQARAARIVVAVPVASRRACADLKDEVDEIACVETPEDFGAVGQWYRDFPQITDEEVRGLLRRAEEVPAGIPSHENPSAK